MNRSHKFTAHKRTVYTLILASEMNNYQIMLNSQLIYLGMHSLCRVSTEKPEQNILPQLYQPHIVEKFDLECSAWNLTWSFEPLTMLEWNH